MPIKQAIWKVGDKPTALTPSSLKDEKQLETGNTYLSLGLGGSVINQDATIDQDFNPGDITNMVVWAYLPYGSDVRDVFAASSPTDIHLFDAPLNVKLSN